MRDADGVDDIDELKARMKRSYEALKLLIEAWARYEDELSDGPPKDKARDSRSHWGMVAREFFRNE